MLTSRGWLFVLFVGSLLLLAVLSHHAVLAVLALALALWFAWEWLLFGVRSRIIARQIELSREVCDERGTVDSLWAGRSFTVRGELTLDEWLGLPQVAILDQFPLGAELIAGDPHTAGALGLDQPLRWSYRIRCPEVGRVRFEGVQLRLADLQGFFYLKTFQPGAVEYRVLPRMASASGRPAMKKRHNLLPPPGIHRLRRAGSGSELLDLRDYMPGDPPKTIAWKVSARRDRLITKEFESEVPIRCTLFVDASSSVRVGPPGDNALARLVEIASAVAQANAADRDLTGLCLFDESSAVPVRAGRGSRHLADMMNRLVDAAARPPAVGQAPLEPILRLAHAFAEEVYPDSLRRDVNRVPFWLPWLARRIQQDRRWWWPSRLPLYLLALVVPPLLVTLGQYALTGEVTSGSFAISLPIVLVLAALIFFWPREARLARWRKRLAAILAVRYDLGPGGLGFLLENDAEMARMLQRFLGDHHVPYPLSLYDAQGRYRFASPQKVNILTNALLRAVGKGHDNELFVLLADLLEVGEELDPLVRAVRVALSRHHQVVIVCPWPRGFPLPERQDPRHSTRRWLSAGADVAAIVRQAEIARFQRSFQQLKRRFARMEVPVVSAASDEPISVILERMDRLRRLGRRR